MIRNRCSGCQAISSRKLGGALLALGNASRTGSNRSTGFQPLGRSVIPTPNRGSDCPQSVGRTQVNVLGTTRSTVYLAFAYIGCGGLEVAAPGPSDPATGP